MPKATYKTPEQIEFADLFERIEKRGYNRADVSRELHVSRAAITNILKGDSNASERTLAGMRALVKRIEDANVEGEGAGKKPGSLEQARKDLQFLEKYDPASYEAARAAITALKRNVISSKPLSETEERALSGAASALHLSQESERKRKAALPSESKPGPKRGAGGRSK